LGDTAVAPRGRDSALSRAGPLDPPGRRPQPLRRHDAHRAARARTPPRRPAALPGARTAPSRARGVPWRGPGQRRTGRLSDRELPMDAGRLPAARCPVQSGVPVVLRHGSGAFPAGETGCVAHLVGTELPRTAGRDGVLHVPTQTAARPGTGTEGSRGLHRGAAPSRRHPAGGARRGGGRGLERSGLVRAETPRPAPGARRPLPARCAVVPATSAGLAAAVLPSRWENGGGGVEPLAAACPTVAPAVGGLLDIVTHGETGWLVPPGDPDRLASAIVEAIDNPAEA